MSYKPRRAKASYTSRYAHAELSTRDRKVTVQAKLYEDGSMIIDRTKGGEVTRTELPVHLTYADELLIDEARQLYQSDDVEIDDSQVKTSRAEKGSGDGENGEPTGTWVAAWVWVPDSDLAPDGKPCGEQEGSTESDSHYSVDPANV